jgi:hypothetical protein
MHPSGISATLSGRVDALRIRHRDDQRRDWGIGNDGDRTWNVENLFSSGRAASSGRPVGLAATITAAGVDVLAVQEVGDPLALDELVAQLGSEWRHVTSTSSTRPIQ